MELKTYHLHIKGIVQGVGFRPMIYKLAKELGFTGYVKNGYDGVHVIFNASAASAGKFVRLIRNHAPAQSKITSVGYTIAHEEWFNNFEIVPEEDSDINRTALISPDLAICDECREEIHIPANRRHLYPFITCTQCGPRYSIIEALPYERSNTTMQPFTMCERCKKEYLNVNDRRFFSQTNSCPVCGIQLELSSSADMGLRLPAKDILALTNSLLQAGKIIAVKGIGGYLLLCDAGNADSIHLLRIRKHRPSKPFAVLYPALAAVQEDFYISKKESDLLQGSASPIVLLQPNEWAANALAMQDIAPGLRRVAVMVPYSPLLEIIAGNFGKPLIATSANISGSPIIYKDNDAACYLFDFADYKLSYNRAIVVPQDDSVVQVTRHAKQQIVMRRSRGFAPSFLSYEPEKNGCVLAAGAFMKSSFTVSFNGNVFISQFLGTGESYESQLMYKETLNHWLGLYHATPTMVIADKHPGYFSRLYAKELAAKFNVEIQFVQHHEAHFAAVLAEHGLIGCEEPILGVCWDGTGFGNDGNLWGGEFFTYHSKCMARSYHLDYFPAIAGDRLAIEPRIAALCVAAGEKGLTDFLHEKFSDAEWSTYTALIARAKVFSSSIGRVFDAVASILHIADRQSYEGEAAMQLQALAETFVDTHGFAVHESYFKIEDNQFMINAASMCEGIMLDLQEGQSRAFIAAKFHFSMVTLIGQVASKLGVNKICFSGGVFQNSLLVDWLNHEYRHRFQLFFHNELSPNDENISFGQLVYYDHDLQSSGFASSSMASQEYLPGSQIPAKKSGATFH